MKKILKLTAAILMILGAGGWMIYAYARTRPGAVANNGVTDDMPPIPEEVRKKMEARWQSGERPKFDRNNPPSEAERQQMREQFEKELTPQDRDAMQKAGEQRRRTMAVTKAALSEEDQARMREKMRGRGFGGRGGFGRGPGGGPPRDGQPAKKD